MKSFDLLQKLERIELLKNHRRYSLEDISHGLSKIKRDSCYIEAAIGVESAFNTIFDQRNVPDDLQEAFEMSYSQVSKSVSLSERYSEMVGRSPESVSGFVSNLKGKVFELRLPDLLEDQFPEHDIVVSPNPIQKVFDITITSPTGEPTLLQAKMGGSGYASDVLERVQGNPDVLFATSEEIQTTILSAHPELAGQFVDTGMSNYELTKDVKQDLALLAENQGIDVPDQIGEMLPYIGEVVLAIRLLVDLVSVQKDFKDIKSKDKLKLSGMKTIVLMSRFGVTAVCTTAGSAGGAAGGSVIAPGIGTLAGGVTGAIGGAVVAAKLNKHLKPHYMKYALGLVGLTDDDVFYFRNKNTIDRVANSFMTVAKNINGELASCRILKNIH